MVGVPALMPGLTARQNLRCMVNLYPRLPARRVDEVLEETGLADVAERRVGPFSTGMKQRLGLALALLNEPELLILDEPATGLDPAGIHELRALFRNLADRGVTVFLSSHLLHEVELICDRVAVIHRGRVVAKGTVDELTARSAERVAVVTADREGAVRVLSGLPGARDVETEGQRITVAGVSSEVVVYNLVQQGVTPREVTIERPSLEAMFLQLTGASD
jgi:ABC-2 type transport system ATP-binding protein